MMNILTRQEVQRDIYLIEIETYLIKLKPIFLSFLFIQITYY